MAGFHNEMLPLVQQQHVRNCSADSNFQAILGSKGWAEPEGEGWAGLFMYDCDY